MVLKLCKTEKYYGQEANVRITDLRIRIYSNNRMLVFEHNFFALVFEKQ